MDNILQMYKIISHQILIFNLFLLINKVDKLRSTLMKVKEDYRKLND